MIWMHACIDMCNGYFGGGDGTELRDVYKRALIRESVDSLCRDDADMPMPPYIGKACNRPNAAFVSLLR